MPEIQPPSYSAGACYTARQDRMLWSSLICEEGTAVQSNLSGTGANSFAVVPGTGMQVVVRSGRAFVQGDSVQDQGMYFVWNSSDVTLGVSASDPTDDRIDLVVAKVYDAEYEGSVSEWRIEVVTGSASPSPVPPSLPPTALPLAQVRVRAGSTTVSAADITDLRQPYRQCPGHGETSIELGPNVNLDSILLPGTYTQTSSAEAASGSNYPPASANYGSPVAGLLEVMSNPIGTLVWQRYSEHHEVQFVVWERRWSTTSGWGEWYPTGGPGEWTLSPVTATANVSALAAIPGSTYRGVNRAGRLAVQLTWGGPELTADGSANFPDQVLFTITDPAYRPPRDTDILVVRSGIETFYGRANRSGDVLLTHASFPGQKVQPGVTYRINEQWPPT